jgi:large subunit ribosomal protein L7/L12
MSVSCRYAAQCCARQLRASTSVRAVSSSLVQQRIARRHNSTEAAVNPKIAGIVDQISQLTLLETADLVASLKVTHCHKSGI